MYLTNTLTNLFAVSNNFIIFLTEADNKDKKNGLTTVFGLKNLELIHHCATWRQRNGDLLITHQDK